MRVLFVGSVGGNTGPDNANRGFVENWPLEDTVYIADGGTGLEKLHALLAGCLKVDVILSTVGSGKLYSLVRGVARARSLKTVGFCHGYVPYENAINSLGMSERAMSRYQSWLDSCDCVATNSRLQMEFIAEHQPSLQGKLAYANLGIEPFPWGGEAHSQTGGLRIAVTGGTRPIKANEVVAKAVKLLNDSGIRATLAIYGRRYSPNAELDGLVEAGCGDYVGQLSHADYLHDLRSCDMLVMNSRHESFGLSALDAIQAGTSLLMSRSCGVAEVLGLESGDFIENCEDPEEVADKIVALAQMPNAYRIYRQLDFRKIGWKASALKLRDICARTANIKTLG